MTFSEAAMIMMSGVKSIIQPINITKNGIYEAANGIDGYAPVNVNVPDRYDEGYKDGYKEGYSKGVTDGRKSLMDFENGEAPPKEIKLQNGTLIIDNALDEADDSLALSMMLKYGKYVSGEPEQYPDRIYSLSVEPAYDERYGTTYEWIVAYTTHLTESGTVNQYRYGVISTQTWGYDCNSKLLSLGYDPITNNIILTIERKFSDGTTDIIGPTTWSAHEYGVYFQALTNGATVGSLPHI